jgi:UDP-N-acetylglucosamine--N-acetylmuramyl-(pentapeptide) pyrophosphoryl-undecaprenol N-acetylglucosamine transferase
VADRELVVIWTGASGSLEQRVAADELIPLRAIAVGTSCLAGTPLLMVMAANVRDMARVPVGVVQAGAAVREFGEDAVLAAGEHVAIPGLAG